MKLIYVLKSMVAKGGVGSGNRTNHPTRNGYQPIKKVVGHRAISNYLFDALDVDTEGVPKQYGLVASQTDIPSPYAFSSTQEVNHLKDGTPVIIVETAHREHTVFRVPPTAKIHATEESAHKEWYENSGGANRRLSLAEKSDMVKKGGAGSGNRTNHPKRGGTLQTPDAHTVINALDKEARGTVGAKDKQPRKRRDTLATSVVHGSEGRITTGADRKSERELLGNHYDEAYSAVTNISQSSKYKPPATPDEHNKIADMVAETLLGGYADREEAEEHLQTAKKTGFKYGEHDTSPFVSFSPAGHNIQAHQLEWALNHSAKYGLNPFYKAQKSLVEMARTKDPKRAAELGWQTRRAQLKIGDRVKPTVGAGIAYGNQATIVHPSNIKTDGRGIPTNVSGAYKPVDWKFHYAIQYDNGEFDVLPKTYLEKNTDSLAAQHAHNLQQANSHEKVLNTLRSSIPEATQTNIRTRAENLRAKLANVNLRGD